MRRDFDALLSRTSLPFSLRESNNVRPEGEHRVAKDIDELRSAIECVESNKLLMDDFSSGRSLLETLTAKTLPRWSRRWRKELGADVTVVRQYVTWSRRLARAVRPGRRRRGSWVLEWCEI